MIPGKLRGWKKKRENEVGSSPFPQFIPDPMKKFFFLFCFFFGNERKKGGCKRVIFVLMILVSWGSSSFFLNWVCV